MLLICLQQRRDDSTQVLVRCSDMLQPDSMVRVVTLVLTWHHTLSSSIATAPVQHVGSLHGPACPRAASMRMCRSQALRRAHIVSGHLCVSEAGGFSCRSAAHCGRLPVVICGGRAVQKGARCDSESWRSAIVHSSSRLWSSMGSRCSAAPKSDRLAYSTVMRRLSGTDTTASPSATSCGIVTRVGA